MQPKAAKPLASAMGSFTSDVNLFMSDLLRQINAEVEEITAIETDRILSQARQIVNHTHRTFFRLMAQQIINQPGPPSWGEFTPDWEPFELDSSYYRWKVRQGNTNFYTQYGEMAGQLTSLTTDQIFGTPEIKAHAPQAATGRPGVRAVTVGVPGRQRTLGRDAKGRFASAADIFRPRRPALFEVVPFPQARHTHSGNEQLFRQTGDNLYHKLNNGTSAFHPMRPVVDPFIDFFLHKRLFPALKKNLKG